MLLADLIPGYSHFSWASSDSIISISRNEYSLRLCLHSSSLCLDPLSHAHLLPLPGCLPLYTSTQSALHTGLPLLVYNLRHTGAVLMFFTPTQPPVLPVYMYTQPPPYPGGWGMYINIYICMYRCESPISMNTKKACTSIGAHYYRTAMVASFALFKPRLFISIIGLPITAWLCFLPVVHSAINRAASGL